MYPFLPSLRGAPSPAPFLHTLPGARPKWLSVTPRLSPGDPGLLPRSSELRPVKLGLHSSNALHRPGEPPSPGEVSLYLSFTPPTALPSRASSPSAAMTAVPGFDSQAPGDARSSLFSDVRSGPPAPEQGDQHTSFLAVAEAGRSRAHTDPGMRGIAYTLRAVGDRRCPRHPI